MRGSARRALASHSCISARVIASSEAKGSSRASTGLPATRVRRKATRWRIPPESSAGGARLEAGEAEALEESARPRRAPRPCRMPPVAQRQRRVVDRRVPGQEQVALGHEGAAGEPLGAPPSLRRPRLPALGSCSPQISSSSVDLPQPEGPTRPITSCRRTFQVERVERLQVAVGMADAPRFRASSLVSCRTPHS